MRYQGRRQSSNVDDRRGGGGKKVAMGGGLMTIIIIVIALIMGENPLTLLQQVPNAGLQPQQQQQTEYIGSAEEEQLADFVKVVLADTEDVWNTLSQMKWVRTTESPCSYFFQVGYNPPVDLRVPLLAHSIAQEIKNYILILVFTMK